ncbi:MAG: GNAT family N-acetyltransferase [Alphaproteobacteria bacterium]|nr:GNAT family N-acetyltransferase [Alphaproteobacteria bacterium]
MDRAASVRRATLGDHAGMTPLFERFYREEGFNDAVDGVAANLRSLLQRPDTAAFLAEARGGNVGVAAMSTSFGLEVGLYAELEDLYVVPEWRGNGVATQLIEAAMEWARKEGCHDVEIVLTPHAQTTTKLRDWYAARGFVDTGRCTLERRVD